MVLFFYRYEAGDGQASERRLALVRPARRAMRVHPPDHGASLRGRRAAHDDPRSGQGLERRSERREIVEADQQIGQAQTSVIQPCLSGSRPY
jgi:hypothetical protein